MGWELKWWTDKTHLVTLFHKEPDGPWKIMRYMVRKYGQRDGQGRMSFRHTIKGKSDRFKIVDDRGQLIVRPVRGNGPVPYWSHDELIGAAGAKLRRLVMVKGERTDGRVRFLRADAYETFSLIDFVGEVLRGEIAIDFDCREMTPDSDGLRNHGTKFRIPPGSVCRLYAKKQRRVDSHTGVGVDGHHVGERRESNLNKHGAGSSDEINALGTTNKPSAINEALPRRCKS